MLSTGLLFQVSSPAPWPFRQLWEVSEQMGMTARFGSLGPCFIVMVMVVATCCCWWRWSFHEWVWACLEKVDTYTLQVWKTQRKKFKLLPKGQKKKVMPSLLSSSKNNAVEAAMCLCVWGPCAVSAQDGTRQWLLLLKFYTLEGDLKLMPKFKILVVLCFFLVGGGSG